MNKVAFLKKKLEEATGQKVILKENLETSEDVEQFMGFLMNETGLRDALVKAVKQIYEQDMNIETQAIKNGIIKSVSSVINELVSRRSRSMNK